jgi:hypothetical protein
MKYQLDPSIFDELYSKDAPPKPTECVGVGRAMEAAVIFAPNAQMLARTPP